jgi:hypothetical protein
MIKAARSIFRPPNEGRMLNPICAQRLVDPLAPVPNRQRQPSLAAVRGRGAGEVSESAEARPF